LDFTLARAFRVIDEGDRVSEFADAEVVGRSAVYIVEDGGFLDEFQKMSSVDFSRFGLKQWLVRTTNDCVDVISEREPELSVVEVR